MPARIVTMDRGDQVRFNQGSLMAILLSFSVSDTAAGVDDSTMATAEVGSESGVISDSATPAAASIPASDTGTGADAGGPLVAKPSAADSGGGSDASSLNSLFSGAQAGSGTDAGVVGAVASGGDAGSGNDNASPGAAFSSADASAGAEGGTLNAVFSSVDLAAGVESWLLGLIALDVGLGADTSSLAAAIVQSESAIVSENIAVVARIVVSELPAGLDASILHANLNVDEVGTLIGPDVSLHVQLSVAEVHVAVEQLRVVLRTVSDNGVSDELASLGTLIGSSDQGTLVESFLSLTAAILAQENAVGETTTTLAAPVSGSDVAVGIDQGNPHISFFGADTGSGVTAVESVVAAILAYENGDAEEATYLVLMDVDTGDVSLLAVSGENAKVLSATGSTPKLLSAKIPPSSLSGGRLDG